MIQCEGYRCTLSGLDLAPNPGNLSLESLRLPSRSWAVALARAFLSVNNLSLLLPIISTGRHDAVLATSSPKTHIACVTGVH